MSEEITDISMKNVTKKCDLDCSYKFNYLEQNVLISRDRGLIAIIYQYDQRKGPPVIFNEKKYFPSFGRIISPSPIMIDGSYPEGLMIVTHLQPDEASDRGAFLRDDPLTVIVPFKKSDVSSPASQVIENIINKVKEQTTPMDMSTMTYNLQDVIPVKGFFSIQKEVGVLYMNFIIYGDSGAIPLTSSTIENLKKVTRPLRQQQINEEFTFLPTKELFFNPNGEDNLFSGLTSLTNQSFSQVSSFPSFGSSFLSSGKTTETTKTTQEQSTTQKATTEQSTQEKSLLQSMQIQPSSTGKQKLDISIKNVTGNCDLKCSYGFKYSESSSVAKNNGIMISLTYDSANVPPVTFNGEKYNVGNLMITSPSVHKFNGKNLPGELVITHNPVKGGNSLDVCIPFMSSTEYSAASKILTDIINKVASTAPSSGDSTNLNMVFNLQNIVPKKPFFSYTEGTTDTIVFGELEAIPLASATLSTLKKIIKPYPANIPIVDLFYNSKGPAGGLQLGDGIYISCKPTGSSKEKIPVEYDKTSSGLSISDILQSSIFELIIFVITGCIIFIIIFYVISIFFSYLSSEPIKIPFLESVNK